MERGYRSQGVREGGKKAEESVCCNVFRMARGCKRQGMKEGGNRDEERCCNVFRMERGWWNEDTGVKAWGKEETRTKKVSAAKFTRGGGERLKFVQLAHSLDNIRMNSDAARQEGKWRHAFIRFRVAISINRTIKPFGLKLPPFKTFLRLLPRFPPSHPPW